MNVSGGFCGVCTRGFTAESSDRIRDPHGCTFHKLCITVRLIQTGKCPKCNTILKLVGDRLITEEEYLSRQDPGPRALSSREAKELVDEFYRKKAVRLPPSYSHLMPSARDRDVHKF